MRSAAVLALLLLAINSLPLVTATAGTFTGTLVQAPADEPENDQRWVYLEGRKGVIRRVGIRTAVIVYASSVPDDVRLPVPADSLRPGAEVRVTADQDNAGEWHASRIEILRLARSASAHSGILATGH